jgi:hypothetical protein
MALEARLRPTPLVVAPVLLRVVGGPAALEERAVPPREEPARGGVGQGDDGR